MDLWEIKAFELIYELAKILEKGSQGEKVLASSLELIASKLSLPRCAISSVSPVDGKIRICAAYGLDSDQIRAGEYLPGEGIIGNVIAKAKPVYIEDVAKEPLFLNRTGSRNPMAEHIAFSCAPIIHCGEVIGSLWLDQVKDEKCDPASWLRVLRIIAAMLAPAVPQNQVNTQKYATRNLKFGKFVGNSPAIQQVYAQIMQVAPSRLTVFLSGESGTGKELAARAIHEGSPRAKGPFISVNCAAIPESLVESELFGHERGAFTGAIQTRKGKFELADHGTLFLDEIGETSLAVQARLLRVLQDQSFERIGGAAAIHTDVRIIVATNRNLAEMVSDGSFRMDLYYRLNVFPIVMPALRDRPEDISELATYFLQREAALAKKPGLEISPAVLSLLKQYPWPGNIRELENVMERSALLACNTILPEHLPPNFLPNYEQEVERRQIASNLKADLKEREKKAIFDALVASQGHIGKAAKSLGMTKRVFSLRLNEYGMDYRNFRSRKRG